MISTAGPLFIFAEHFGDIPHFLRLTAVVGEEQPRIWKSWVRCQIPFLEEVVGPFAALAAAAVALAPDNKYADEKDEKRDESHDAASGDSSLVMMQPKGPKGQGWSRSM